MLETVLHDWHVSAEARMVDFAGWHMPIMYTSIVDEHHAVRKQSGLFDIAHMGRLWFAGPDACEFLDHILTNHVAKMDVGQVRYSLVCREDGGILDDVLIYRFVDRYLLVVNGANREKIVEWIGSQQGGFDFAFHDETLSSFMLAIQGPQAEAILSPHVDTSLGEISYYHTIESKVFGKQAIVSRTGYTGEDGFEVIVPLEDGVDLWTAVMEAGGESITACGLGCRDTLRLEAAMPLYGHEMDESVDPVTAGLGFGVKLKKDGFVGKAAIEEIKTRSDVPKRVGVELAGRRIAREGALLIVDGRQVGHITSGTFSPTLEKSIGMGYVEKSFAVPGSEIEVEIRGKREPARVVALPFYKRS